MKTDEFPPGSMQWFHPVLKEEVVFVFEGYGAGYLYRLHDNSRWSINHCGEWVPLRLFTPEEQAQMMADLLAADSISQNWI